jgi:hypothetical protein
LRPFSVLVSLQTCNRVSRVSFYWKYFSYYNLSTALMFLTCMCTWVYMLILDHIWFVHRRSKLLSSAVETLL